MEKMNFGSNEPVAVGDQILIIDMADMRSQDYAGRTGIVTHIDSIGQLHGTWGGLAVIPEADSYELLSR